MNKRILVVGGSLFVKEYYKNGTYHVSNKRYLNKVYSSYSVDNLSEYKLTVAKAQYLVSAFVSNYSYSSCILGLGEADIQNNTSIDDFKNGLVLLIQVLRDNGIEPVLFNMPSNIEHQNHEYYQAIQEVRRSFSLTDSVEAIFA